MTTTRVEITYGGDDHEAVELPFVVGVLADLSGTRREPLAALLERKVVDVDLDNLDELVRRARPRLELKVADTLVGEGSLGVDLEFESLEDFSPAGVARGVTWLATLLDARTRLSQSLLGLLRSAQAAKGSVDLEPPLVAVLEARNELADRGERSGDSPEPLTLAEAIRSRFDSRCTDPAALVERFLAATREIPDDLIKDVEDLIRALDERLTEQINPILHDEAFRALESTWRGLRYLVEEVRPDERIKIRVLNISKKELTRILQRYKGSVWDQSPLFRKFYGQVFGETNVAPYGCLVGDFTFDHSPPDISTLREMAQLAWACQAPFISAAGPGLFWLQSWRDLAVPRDLGKIVQHPEHTPWRSLRDCDDANHLVLTLPRVLARLPYGPDTALVNEFDFREEVGDGEAAKYTWMNSAYVLTATICRSFREHGWFARLAGSQTGGVVEGLPCHAFSSEDGDIELRGPTEVLLNARREIELSRCGLLALHHQKGTGSCVFFHAQTLRKPQEYEDPDATEVARRMTSLPYLLTAWRFALYLKCIVRDLYPLSDSETLEAHLQRWVADYIDPDPTTSSEAQKARRPLCDATVRLQEIPGRPGFLSVRLVLSHSYQLEPLTVNFRLVFDVIDRS